MPMCKKETWLGVEEADECEDCRMKLSDVDHNKSLSCNDLQRQLDDAEEVDGMFTCNVKTSCTDDDDDGGGGIVNAFKTMFWK